MSDETKGCYKCGGPKLATMKYCTRCLGLDQPAPSPPADTWTCQSCIRPGVFAATMPARSAECENCLAPRPDDPPAEATLAPHLEALRPLAEAALSKPPGDSIAATAAWIAAAPAAPPAEARDEVGDVLDRLPLMYVNGREHIAAVIRALDEVRRRGVPRCVTRNLGTAYDEGRASRDEEVAGLTKKLEDTIALGGRAAAIGHDIATERDAARAELHAEHMRYQAALTSAQEMRAENERLRTALAHLIQQTEGAGYENDAGPLEQLSAWCAARALVGAKEGA